MTDSVILAERSPLGVVGTVTFRWEENPENGNIIEATGVFEEITVGDPLAFTRRGLQPVSSNWNALLQYASTFCGGIGATVGTFMAPTESKLPTPNVPDDALI